MTDAAGERPFPPGRYPVVVVGSGAGGLQTSYSLARLGVSHALISDDDAPGGMFRRFPLFQRLITWTKPYAPVERGTRAYQWYDWNSLLSAEEAHRVSVAEFMDGVSYFPTRAEMEAGIVAFTERSSTRVRFGCRWESTRREDDGFVIVTSDGEYRCKAAVIAVGMTEPWKPLVPGFEHVPHYVDTKPAAAYAGKRVFVAGKRNSGFEIADGLLPWARQVILASPRPARISVVLRTTAAARARYLQPYEDHVLGGGTLVLDAAIERVERTATGFRVVAKGTTNPVDLTLEADEVIAATGFTTPLRDLSALGVATFYQGRLPAQTPYWESATVPGIYFAGSITQGSIGMKKYGIPSNSAAVHGFRYNAAVLARHIARTHFRIDPEPPRLPPDRVVDYLLSEATSAPELWNQQSYLARVLTFEPGAGIVDDGISPLAHFVDHAGPDGVALAVETDNSGDIHPAVYLRRGGRVEEHLMHSDPLLDFRGGGNRKLLADLLRPVLG
ncbi:MAG: NAD(P)-binding domain-containing protein [Actinomycetota bacterium]